MSFFLNTLSKRFINEEKEEMRSDLLILLGINDLRSFLYKLKK
jgi:hypothetical protein